MKKKKYSWIIGLVISLAALTIAVWGVQPARLFEVLEGASYLYLVPMTGLLFSASQHVHAAGRFCWING